MAAKEYLESKCKQLDTTQPFWGNQEVTAAQAIGAMKSYHQSKSKEEADERYKKAMEYLDDSYSCEKYGDAEGAIKLAAFGKEQS